MVVCDRFVSSTLAYQVDGDGLTAAQIRSIADVAIRGRWPDLTIILDMPVEMSFARMQRRRDRIEQRSLEYHGQVRLNYLQQAKADPKRCRVIDAARAREQVHEDIWRAVMSLCRTDS